MNTTSNHLPSHHTATEILENLKDMIWKFRGLRRTTVLFIAHPADYQSIIDNTIKYTPTKSLLKLTPAHMMGVPVWKSPKIERGAIRSYYSWLAAYEDLKDILGPKDVEFLKMKMEAEQKIHHGNPGDIQ